MSSYDRQVELQPISYRSFRSNRGLEDSKQLELLQSNHLERILNQQQKQFEADDIKWYPSFLQKLGRLCIPCALCCRCCFSNPFYQQQTGEVGLLERFGRYIQNIQPGLKILNPITQRVKSISLKTNTLIFQQQAITKDNVQIKIESVLFVRIISPSDLAYKLGNQRGEVFQCITEVSKASLRFIVGSFDLQTIIQTRSLTAGKLMEEINRQINIWGILVQNCSIKQLFLPIELSQTLSQVATSRRRAQAMIIGAKANVECAKLLKQVSTILDTRAAMQIRYLETIQQILNGEKDRIVFMNTNLAVDNS